MQLTLIVLLVLIPSITTFKCYICNSNEHVNCADDGKLDSFKQECNLPEPYCRKIVQTVNEQTSIVRTCGSKATAKPCYKTAGVNTANVCSCNSDLCNNAPSFSQQQRMIMIAAAISMIFLR